MEVKFLKMKRMSFFQTKGEFRFFFISVVLWFLTCIPTLVSWSRDPIWTAAAEVGIFSFLMRNGMFGFWFVILQMVFGMSSVSVFIHLRHTARTRFQRGTIFLGCLVLLTILIGTVINDSIMVFWTSGDFLSGLLLQYAYVWGLLIGFPLVVKLLPTDFMRREL
jgi:hypothetical protein